MTHAKHSPVHLVARAHKAYFLVDFCLDQSDESLEVIGDTTKRDRLLGVFVPSLDVLIDGFPLAELPDRGWHMTKHSVRFLGGRLNVVCRADFELFDIVK